MASVNAMGSIYGSIVAKNKGIGGLASGLDTESIMEALTTGTRSKIAKQQQNKQLAQWKQDAYRSVATSLSAFQQKYLKFGKDNTNIASSSFFNSYKASSSSSKVKVTNTTNSSLGDIKIDEILNLATTNTIKSTNKAQQVLAGREAIDGLSTTVDNFTGKTLSITVDGTTEIIKLDTLNRLNGTTLVSTLENLIKDAFGTKSNGSGGTENIVTVAMNSDNCLEITHSSGQVTINTDNDILGLKKGDSNKIDVRSTKLKDVKGLQGELVGDGYRFKINDTVFTFSGNDTLDSIMTKINSSAANVRMTYSTITGNFEITSKVSGYANIIKMNDEHGNFLNTIFGSKSGSAIASTGFFSNDPLQAEGSFQLFTDYNNVKGSTSDKIDAFLEVLEGTIKAVATGQKTRPAAKFNMTIDGTTAEVKFKMTYATRKKIEFGEDLTEADFLEGLNLGIEEAFGDKADGIQFELAGGKVVLNTGQATKAQQVSISSKGISDGYQLLAMIGFEELEETYTNVVDLSVKDTVEGGTFNSGTMAPGTIYKFKFTVNGRTETISYELTEEDANKMHVRTDPGEKAAYLVGRLNTAIYEEFGEDVATVSSSSPTLLVGFTTDATGKISMFIKNGASVVLEKADSFTADEYDVPGIFGFGTRVDNLADNINDPSFTLNKFGIGSGELDINGTLVLYSSTDTLGKLLDDINSAGNGNGFSARIVDGKLVIDGGDSIAIKDTVTTGPSILTKMYHIGDPATGYTTATTENYGTRSSGGSNAEIRVGNDILSSATNTFTINGTQFEVLEATNGPEEITMTITSEPDDLVDRLKEFILDYNALITSINLIVTEKHRDSDSDYDYQPLSDEQKAEMTTEEIDRWNEQAKKGILRNDPTLNRILSDMRSNLYKSVGASGISLYSIGITTVSVLSNAEKAGHLEITADNEIKLRNAITNNPDAIRDLFINANNGLATNMENIINRAISTSSDKDKRGSLITIAGTTVSTGNNTSSLDDKIKAYDEAITRLKKQLETEYNRYWKQFSALETAIQKMNTQSSWLTDFVAS